jgi:hypothetical protein
VDVFLLAGAATRDPPRCMVKRELARLTRVADRANTMKQRNFYTVDCRQLVSLLPCLEGYLLQE